MQSLKHTTAIISERGNNKKAYSTDDKMALLICLNIAKTLKTIIDAPIITADSMVTKEIEVATQVGFYFLEKAKTYKLLDMLKGPIFK